jgi:putative transposase
MHYRDRQQRPQAWNIPGHAHELTFSCYRKYPFLTDRTATWLSQEIQEARQKLNYALWAYVFMPDHVHLVIWPREREYEDSDFLRAIKEPVSRKAVQFLKRESPHWLEKIRVQHATKVQHHFWQPGRGHDRNIETTQTLLAMIDYIHLNPVRRGLVERACDWRWSSAGWYEGSPLNDLKPDPIPWDWLEEVANGR